MPIVTLEPDKLAVPSYVSSKVPWIPYPSMTWTREEAETLTISPQTVMGNVNENPLPEPDPISAVWVDEMGIDCWVPFASVYTTVPVTVIV